MSDDDRPFIAGEISDATGEVMVSAGDVVRWLRNCSETAKDPYCRRYVEMIADQLASEWIDASAEAMERNA